MKGGMKWHIGFTQLSITTGIQGEDYNFKYLNMPT